MRSDRTRPRADWGQGGSAAEPIRVRGVNADTLQNRRLKWSGSGYSPANEVITFYEAASTTPKTLDEGDETWVIFRSAANRYEELAGGEVAEELDPIQSVITGRSGTLEFKMAQATRRNLYLALNMGAAGANDGTTVEPPDPSAMVRVMLLHVSNDAGSVRGTLFRQCFNTGGLEEDFSKAPKKVLLPVMFKLEKPTGKKPFITFPNASGVIA